MTLSTDLMQDYHQLVRDQTLQAAQKAVAGKQQIKVETLTKREIKLLRRLPRYISKKLGVEKSKIRIIEINTQNHHRLRYFLVDDLILCYYPGSVAYGCSNISWYLLVLAKPRFPEMRGNEPFVTSKSLCWLGRVELTSVIGKLFNDPLSTDFRTTSVSAPDIINFAKSKATVPA